MNDINTLIPDVKLRFNVEHLDLENCYTAGYECAQAEIEENANPFAEGSLEYEYWTEGWWAGFYGEEPFYSTYLEPEEAHKPLPAANEANFRADEKASFFYKVLEITGVLAVSAIVGYQVIDLVA